MTKINKDALIRTIAERTQFNLGDTREFLDTLIEVFEEALVNGEEIDIYGFGKLIVQELPERKGSGLFGRKVLPPARRVFFRLSRNLRDAVK